jgi:hypothetical protein
MEAPVLTKLLELAHHLVTAAQLALELLKLTHELSWWP